MAKVRRVLTNPEPHPFQREWSDDHSLTVADILAVCDLAEVVASDAALRAGWEATSPGVLFDVAFGCLARSPLRDKVSVHDFRALMLDVQESIAALGYAVAKPTPTRS